MSLCVSTGSTAETSAEAHGLTHVFLPDWPLHARSRPSASSAQRLAGRHGRLRPDAPQAATSLGVQALGAAQAVKLARGLARQLEAGSVRGARRDRRERFELDVGRQTRRRGASHRGTSLRTRRSRLRERRAQPAPRVTYRRRRPARPGRRAQAARPRPATAVRRVPSHARPPPCRGGGPRAAGNQSRATPNRGPAARPAGARAAAADRPRRQVEQEPTRRARRRATRQRRGHSGQGRPALTASWSRSPRR